MVHRSRARSSSLFLMELILAILFFSVASAVCIEFFVKAHLMSLEAEALTYAVNECSGAAEILCTADSLAEGIELLETLYPGGDYPDFSRTTGMTDLSETVETEEEVKEMEEETEGWDAFIYYDDSYAPCEQEQAACVMTLHMTQEEQMTRIVVEMFRGDRAGHQEEPVYRLETRHHIARRTAFHEG